MDDQWISIQEGTFRNWCNEQLKPGGRSVSNIAEDFCDGVNLVALVEALQFRKIGKVFTKPTSMIQKLQNVSLALTAITDDNVKLVNVGSDDIVGGNTKIILGLMWSLVQRYQISAKKSKAPPKKLMMAWFRALLPELDVTNFTSDWVDGVALHALLERLKPGTSPEWHKLSRKERVENCRRAMVLAKEVLNIPRVIRPEDFANPALDELSSMTYLSYFVKFESPGYYHTLNWACKQLRTTNITNLTSDWTDGYFLCAIVHSLGGNIPQWPNIDRTKKQQNCQMALDAAKELGIEVNLTAAEMTDVTIDHLSIMSLLSKFETVKPKKTDAEKAIIRHKLDNVKIGARTEFELVKADNKADNTKFRVTLRGPVGDVQCDVAWRGNNATCSFTPTSMGQYILEAFYQDTKLRGCPVEFAVKGDSSKCRLITSSARIVVGEMFGVKVNTGGNWSSDVVMESNSPSGELQYLQTERQGDIYEGKIQPRAVGLWRIHVYVGESELTGSPVELKVTDPKKVWMEGPEKGFIGDLITYKVYCDGASNSKLSGAVTRNGFTIPFHLNKDHTTNDLHLLTFTLEQDGEILVSLKADDLEVKGSPARVISIDAGEIKVFGEGLVNGIRGDPCRFSVDMGNVSGDLTVQVLYEVGQVDIETVRKSADVCEFIYTPQRAGNYVINVCLDKRHLPGSPFQPRITDKSRVYLMDDLTEQKDENEHLALEYGKETVLNYNIAEAGPESTIEISETAGIQNSHLASAKPQPQSKEIQVQSHLQSWIDFDLKPVFLRMPQLLPDFEAGKRINPDLRRHFVREVVNEVRKVSIHCDKKEFETIAQKITRKYPNTFEDRIGDIRIGSGHDSVLKQLLSRNENLNRSTAQSPRHESKKGKEGKEVVCKRKSVSERDTYGCVNWSPVLSNEDMEEQENIRKELIDMHSTMERDMEKVYENMNSSYGLLRKMINEGKPIEQLISEWPFLSQACVLLKHCEKLIGLNVPANVENAYLQKGPVLLRYLRSKTELSQFLGQLETEKNNDNYQAILPAVLLSIQKCLGEEMTSLMFSVDEMASNEEIEQANTESWPRLAMLGQFSAEVLSPDGRIPVNIRNPDKETVQVGFTAKVEGDHYIHLYWSNVALDQSPILAYCPGPVLPVNHAAVVIRGEGHLSARATVDAEFMIDGRKAGPGIPRVRMHGVKSAVDVEMKALKYDRYKCKYSAPYPGGYLLNVEWSSLEIPGSPFKVNVTTKGFSHKVKVEGPGLHGGFVGQELRVVVDTTEAGNGEVSSDCMGLRHMARCDQISHRDGKYTLRIFPTEACRHKLDIKYDGDHVPGSPFYLPVGEPPDPRNVRVYGPGIEPGVIQKFESKFIVETYGAGAGQLAVRIRGPRGAFTVDMKRDRQDERTILCRYDPEEHGEYMITVKWSGVHVPGSPFTVPIFESMEALYKHAKQTKQIELIADYQWKEEI